MRSRLLASAMVVAGLVVFTAGVAVSGGPGSKASRHNEGVGGWPAQGTAVGVAKDAPTTAWAECTRLPLPASAPGTVPGYDPGDRYGTAVAAARARYTRAGTSYAEYLQTYSAAGDYLNYGATLRYEADPTVRFDAEGIPLIAYGGIYHYNPVTIAEFALTLHGRYVRGAADAGEFLGVAGFLVRQLDERGALQYGFPYEYYLTGEILQPGWASAMAQGQVLSVLSRAYRLSGEERYLEAGRAVFAFLATGREAGGSGTVCETSTPPWTAM